MMDHKQIGEALWAAGRNVLPKLEQPLVHRTAAAGVFQKALAFRAGREGRGRCSLQKSPIGSLFRELSSYSRRSGRQLPLAQLRVRIGLS